MSQPLKGKKVLLLGLGVLGGGVYTARWLVAQGAQLTVTDLKREDQLESALDRLSDIRDQIRFVLGRHDEDDIRSNELIVVNPDVPLASPFLQLALSLGKEIQNELTLFYAYCPHGQIVAITGTRGKTTTTNWVAHLLRGAFSKTSIAGNSPDAPLLKEGMTDAGAPVVIEAPSFLLEHTIRAEFRPNIAIITNIYQDHLNRYQGIEDYAATKGNIFKDQTPDDLLILNQDNPWTEFFLKAQPKSTLKFFSLDTLSDDRSGVFLKGTVIYLKDEGQEERYFEADAFIASWGMHNVGNLLAAILAARAIGVSKEAIIRQISSLPQIKFRQECVYKNEGLEICNDTTATSPDATIAAIERFQATGKRLLLITGGTNRELEYTDWAKTVKKYLPANQVIFLEGSATELMKQALGWNDAEAYSTLSVCIDEVQRRIKGPTIVLFSPSSKSFEKFKNEYDRGEQFNALIKERYDR